MISMFEVNKVPRGFVAPSVHVSPPSTSCAHQPGQPTSAVRQGSFVNPDALSGAVAACPTHYEWNGDARVCGSVQAHNWICLT